MKRLVKPCQIKSGLVQSFDIHTPSFPFIAPNAIPALRKAGNQWHRVLRIYWKVSVSRIATACPEQGFSRCIRKPIFITCMGHLVQGNHISLLHLCITSFVRENASSIFQIALSFIWHQKRGFGLHLTSRSTIYLWNHRRSSQCRCIG